MKLRRAQKEDLARVVEIYNSSIEWRLSTADTNPVPMESKAHWFNSHTDDRPLLICEDMGNVSGWVSIQRFNERPAYDNTVEISVYIDHVLKGRGLGTEILTQVMELLPSLGVRTAIANVFCHNDASIRLFKKFGFKDWGKLHNVCEMDGMEYSVSILGCKIGT